MTKWLWYWGPVAGYVGLIFYVSSLPHPDKELPIPELGDKALHIIEYAVLGALCFRAFRWATTDRLAQRAFLWAVLASSLYGLSDEVHQLFVPPRESSWLDCLADVIGSFVGAWVMSRHQRVSAFGAVAAPRRS